MASDLVRLLVFVLLVMLPAAWLCGRFEIAIERRGK